MAAPVPRKAQSQCPRGHALTPDNLKPSDFKRGHRTCLVCDRAKALKWWQRNAEREKAKRRARAARSRKAAAYA
jgi:hypothetical protein